MALRRRDFLLTVPVCAGVVWACTSTQQTAGQARFAELAAVPPTESTSRTVLVCMPETKQTREVWTGLADELGGVFRVVAVRSEGANAADHIAQAIEHYKPAGIVLMNNPTVAAYRAYQAASTTKRFPPAVIVMSSFLEGRPRRLSAATGISYEVPLITVVTNLRKVIATPIERVGVVHRAPLKGFVTRQAALASREQTLVFREEVSTEPNPSEIKRAIRLLKQRSDAIWILNDDHLLTPRLISEAWLPALNEKPWIPAIVGAASLVSPQQSFGTLAVLPDHTALGAQAANLIFDIADQNWTVPETSEAELPLSTTTTVDLPQVTQRFQLREDALSQVDRVLER